MQPLAREALLERMATYAQRELAQGERLAAITRHMLGLYGGEPGAREYRRLLSQGARAAGAGPELLRERRGALCATGQVGWTTGALPGGCERSRSGIISPKSSPCRRGASVGGQLLH